MFLIQKIKRVNWIILAILLANICVITYYFSLKTDFHVDEYFTFGHANSTQGPFLMKDITSLSENFSLKCFNPDDVRNYLIVQPDKRFEYKNVLNNIKMDVHPPLYYFIIHTIYSFFPNTYNRWFGFTVNIVFFILTFFVLYKFAQDIFQDKTKTYLILVFWGFCMTTLNMSVLIRSYMMQMFIGTFLLYEHYQLIKQEKVKFTTLFQIFLFSYIGFLTHYYVLVLSFIIAAVTCCYFMWQKRIRDLFVYAGVMLLSVVLFCCSLPFVFNVFLYTSLGEELQELDWSSYYQYHTALSRIAELVMMYILAFRQPYYQFFTFFVIMGISIIILQSNRRKVLTEITIQTFYVILFMFLIGIISPDMIMWDDRYFSLIIPVLSLLMIYYFILLLQSLCVNNKNINIILSVVVFLNVFFTNWQDRSSFFMYSTENTRDVFEKLRGKDVLLFTKGWLGAFSFMADYSSFNSLCVFDRKDIDNGLLQMREKTFDYFIFYKYVDYGEDETDISLLNSLEAKLQDNNFTFLKVFKKGMYVYNLYKNNSEISR